MAESRAKRAIRYGKYVLQWIFLEKLRGLDFTMRDTSLLTETGGVLHGYSKTDEKHAKEIFQRLEIDGQKRLLDIGCGKGAFLKEAAKEPFGDLAGIEYSDKIADIAKRNFRRMGLSEKVRIYQGDAAEFQDYQRYNVFYFFNPFGKEVMEKVMKRIVRDQKEKSWIILHHPTCAAIVESYGGNMTCRIFDPVKSYETIIYELEMRE